MDLSPFLDGFVSWSQTPLGANIVGPITVVVVTALGFAFVKFVRSIPARFDRWLKRRVGLL